MSKNTKKLVPKLRFPEFQESEEWEYQELDPYLQGYSKRVPSNTQVPIYSSTRTGLRPQKDYFDDRELINDGEYGLVPDEYFVYRHMSDDGTFKFNINKTGGEIAVSKEYPVFTTLNLHSEFLLNLLNEGEGFKEFALAQKKGGTRTRLYLKVLRAWKALLPSYSEQQKISDCLSSIDDLITAQTQKVEALKTHKKGLMQQLFPREGETVPRLRFPEFRNAGEWEILPFKEIAKFLSGGTPSKDVSEYWGGAIPWISASSMHTTKIDKSDSNITELAVSDGARIAKKGTLLLLVRGSMLHKRIPIGIAETDVSFNQDVKAIELKGDIAEQYLMNFLIASESKLLAAVTATGIGAGKLDTSDLNDFPIKFPLLEEQQKIADCLSRIENLISAQIQKLESLKNHKKGLMQQLFPSTEADIE